MDAREAPLKSDLSNQKGPKSVSEVYALIGWGKYQRVLFVIAGLGFCADAIETGLISFLDKQVKSTWDISTKEANLLAGAVFLGELLGCCIWGPMADRMGRRTAFLVANVTLFSFGVLSAMSPSFHIFVALRGIVGLAIGGIIIPFDNLAESVEEKHTVSVTFSLNYFWSFGSLFVALVAAGVLQEENIGGIDSWRILTVLCALPIFLACLGYFYIEESPLWLQDVGRDEEALAVLQRIAQRNGKEISGVELVPYERESEPTCAEVVSRKFRARTTGLALIWAGGVLGYYGASLATPTIFGDKDDSTNYGALIFGTSGEIIGVSVVVLLSQYLGYMRAMGVFYLSAALFTATILAKDALPVPIIAVFDFILRASCMGGNTVMYGATPLAYPTHIRGTAGGFHYAMGRLGAIAAAATGAMSFQGQMFIYIAANFIAGSTSFFFGKDFELGEEQAELKSELDASVLERRESSFIKKESRSFLSSAGGSPATHGSVVKLSDRQCDA